MIVANAADELRALAETLDIPVSPTLMGKGAIPEDHPLWAGMVGSRRASATRTSSSWSPTSCSPSARASATATRAT